MHYGLVFSIVLHASLLGFALISVAATPPLKPIEAQPAVLADVISASELNRMRQGVREAKLDQAAPKDVKKPDDAAKEIPRPRPVAAPPPPAAEPPPPPPAPAETAKAEPPPPAPKPAPKVEPDKLALAQKIEELALQKAAEEKAKAETEAAAKAKAEAEAEAKAKAEAEEKRKRELAEKKKRELAEKRKKEREEKQKRELAEKQRREREAKKSLDTNRLAALLDKTPDPKRQAAANPDPDSTAKAKGPVRGDAEGRDSTISANEASFLAGLMRQAVSRCWNINAGLDGIQEAVVKVEVRLSPQGDLIGQPKVVNSQSSPVFRDAANSAVRALVQCQPYRLPPDKYAGGWEWMTLTFDPARMF